MAWTRTPTHTAKTTNDDIQILFYVRGGQLYGRIVIENDDTNDPTPESAEALISSSSLTAQEQSDLTAILLKLRNDGLTLLGYTNA